MLTKRMLINKPTKFLKKNCGKWYTEKEIKEKLNLSAKQISIVIDTLSEKKGFYFRPKNKQKEFMFLNI